MFNELFLEIVVCPHLDPLSNLSNAERSGQLVELSAARGRRGERRLLHLLAGESLGQPSPQTFNEPLRILGMNVEEIASGHRATMSRPIWPRPVGTAAPGPLRMAQCSRRSAASAR